MRTAYTEPASLNKYWLGFSLGLGFPAVLFFLYFLFRFHNLSFDRYIQLLVQTGSLVHVMSLCVLPNLIPFMFFVRTNRFKSGRGVIAITILYAITSFALRFFL